MARPLRLEYPGAVIYVTGRGPAGRRIFRDAADRKSFLGFLGPIALEERWRVHAYGLLEDRYELLIETPAGGLSHGMRSLNGRYARRFNRRHGRTGPLLGGRYRSVLVQKGRHLLEMGRSIVWSPVREGLTRQPGGWPWSSYRAMAGKEPAPAWLEVDWTLGEFGRQPPGGRAAYRRFVQEGRRVSSRLDEVRSQVFLGDPRFIREAKRLLFSPFLRKRVRRRSRGPRDPGIREIQRAAAREWGVPPARLRRHGGEEKVAAIYLARQLTPLSNREIGRAFGVGEARVSSVMRDVQQGARSSLAPRLEELHRRLSSGRR